MRMKALHTLKWRQQKYGQTSQGKSGRGRCKQTNLHYCTHTQCIYIYTTHTQTHIHNLSVPPFLPFLSQVADINKNRRVTVHQLLKYSAESKTADQHNTDLLIPKDIMISLSVPTTPPPILFQQYNQPTQQDKRSNQPLLHNLIPQQALGVQDHIL